MKDHMTLSEELQWRGFVHQTSLKDITAIDGGPLSFYWGVDPSAPSMTVGNLAAAMMVRHFIAHGHRAVLLVGGATGLIGDPDGKPEERTLKTQKEINANKHTLAQQYRQVFARQQFEVVDNYDWFKGIGYLTFLRDVGKHVPMRQMLQREFVQSRLGEGGAGISYAEFSYALIQGYDFLHLYREHGVTLQVCGSDQWGNSIAGVELIRRIAGGEAHVWSTPLVINRATGKKFGKTEDGAIWLSPELTSPTQFYQFWVTCDDEGVEAYLKMFTLLTKSDVDEIMIRHRNNPKERYAQTRLAQEVTHIVHGTLVTVAEDVTQALTGSKAIGDLSEHAIAAVRFEIPSLQAQPGTEIADLLARSGLAASKTEARRLLQGSAVSINGQKVSKETLEAGDFQNGRLLIRKGKAFKDSALVEQG